MAGAIGEITRIDRAIRVHTLPLAMGLTVCYFTCVSQTRLEFYYPFTMGLTVGIITFVDHEPIFIHPRSTMESSIDELANMNLTVCVSLFPLAIR